MCKNAGKVLRVLRVIESDDAHISLLTDRFSALDNICAQTRTIDVEA